MYYELLALWYVLLIYYHFFFAIMEDICDIKSIIKQMPTYPIAFYKTKNIIKPLKYL